MAGTHKVSGPHYFPSPVELQKGTQQVLLVPVVTLVDNSYLRVLVWQEDVVDVHHHARSQPGKHLEEQVVHVAASLGHVRRIDQQDIAVAELIEEAQLDILYLPAHQLGGAIDAVDQDCRG